MIKFKKKKKEGNKRKVECGFGGNIQSGLRIYFILFLDKFVLKAWVSRRVSYFVGNVLDEVRYIFLPGYP